MSAYQEIIRYDQVRHISAYIERVFCSNEHMHGSFEINYVLDGEGVCYQNSQARTVSPGSLILSNPFEPHYIAATKTKPLLLLTVQIHQLFVRRYIDIVPKLVFKSGLINDLHHEKYESIKKFLIRTAIACFNFDQIRQFDILGCAVLLMGQLVRNVGYDLKDSTGSSNKELQKTRTQRLISYIDEHYREKLTLSVLAEMEGVSTTYLSHFFRKNVGVNFQAYLTMQRLEKALVLMYDPTISIVDICMNCGFSDCRYLEAACKKTFGCSVAEYRKRIIAGDEFRKDEQSDNSLNKRFSRKDSIAIMEKYFSLEEFDIFP